MGVALTQAGRWRALELAVEAALPSLAATLGLAAVYRLGSGLVAGAPLTLLELALLLGTVAALVAWAAARQVWLQGERRVWRASLIGVSGAVLALLSLGSSVDSALSSTCSKTLSGTLVTLPGESWVGARVCQVGGSPGNGALQGTIYRARWDGSMPLVLWPWVGLVSLVSAAGLRGLRLRPSQVPQELSRLLTRRPGSGQAGALGDPLPKNGQIVACNNQTWWGAACGQIYAAEKTWAPGEWCRRCRLPFQPCAATVRLDVICPITDDVAALNAMERVDAQSWDPATPLRLAGGSVSGAARWVWVGALTLPTVLPVSQALALAFDLLPTWSGQATPEGQRAIATALNRGSRVVAWLWSGPVRDRLHLATPARELALVWGGARLRDLVGGARALALQIDVGVLPIEVRAGFQHQLLAESRAEAGPAAATTGLVHANQRYVTWIVTRPERLASDEVGLWIPRLEGAALRRWLIRDRPPAERSLRPGATWPAPYIPWSGRDRAKPVLGLYDVARAWTQVPPALKDCALQTLKSTDTAALRGVDLLVVEGDPADPATAPRLRALVGQPGTPPCVVLSAGAAWEEEDIAALGLVAWLRLPLEPGDPEILRALAQDAAQARQMAARAAAASQAPLVPVLTPLRGQRRAPAGPAEPTLQGAGEQVEGDADALEPVDDAELPVGASLEEWDWFELPHLARLRREVVVIRRPPDGRGP